MLGYTQDDINKMQASISLVSNATGVPAPIKEGLEMANSFFDGLWAEGYLD